jgi:hypothetical protein
MRQRPPPNCPKKDSLVGICEKGMEEVAPMKFPFMDWQAREYNK